MSVGWAPCSGSLVHGHSSETSEKRTEPFTSLQFLEASRETVPHWGWRALVQERK